MRNKSIDGLKGIAIIGVVLYHMGLLTYGYLGVDVFLVIAGFFSTKSLMKEDVKVISFLGNRLKRLYPAVILAGIVSLAFGLWGMLPDDLENVSEQIIASNTFTENILSAITTKNYWDVVNDYKPLMHMWYVGILFEFYLLYPFVFKFLNRINKTKIGIIILSVISFMIYILPLTSSSNKFYYLPFRFFEFGIGAVICIFHFKKESRLLFYGAGFALITLIALNPLFVPSQARLVSVVIMTSIMIVTMPDKENIIGNNVFVQIGMRSYSIFIWHQVFLAYYRYFYSNKVTLQFAILFIVFVAIISEASYRLIEKKMGEMAIKPTIVCCAVLFLFSSGVSGWIYLHAGVVRDIPELDIYMNDVHRGMHAEYCDRLYRYDHDFADNGQLKVLIVGNSFARDWGNILIESNLPLDISYSYSITENIIPRIKEADYVFYRFLFDEIPSYGFDTKAKIYGIGTKNFGESNGIVYKNRNSNDYYNQTVEVDSSVMIEYLEEREKWGTEHYIDMIKPVEVSDGIVRVFTDDHKFISQDCRHLTKAGARYYSSLLDLNSIFNFE